MGSWILPLRDKGKNATADSGCNFAPGLCNEKPTMSRMLPALDNSQTLRNHAQLAANIVQVRESW